METHRRSQPSSEPASASTSSTLSPVVSPRDNLHFGDTSTPRRPPPITVRPPTAESSAYVIDDEPSSPRSGNVDTSKAEQASVPGRIDAVSSSDRSSKEVDVDDNPKTMVPPSPEIKSKPLDDDASAPLPAITATVTARSSDIDIEAASIHTSSSSSSSCHRPERNRNLRDVGDALALAWDSQKRNLFTSWIHIPLGIVSILVLCWAIKIGIDRAPFRFPAPVLGMAFLFGMLLLLDWLSLKFPGHKQSPTDPEKQLGQPRPDESHRRFLEPVMKLIAPPCDFCLRNMSVMFTPSFILIPAREVIPGKEIALLTAWFAISQVAAFVFPVLLYRAFSWIEKQPAKVKQRRQRKADLRRIQSRRNSNATLAGGELAKVLSSSGGKRGLSTIATGLNDLTAIVTAPVSHITMGKSRSRYEDERLQIMYVQIETARQQGDPAVATPADVASMTGSPEAHCDGFFQHRHPYHCHHHHHHRHHHAPGLQRGRSMTRALETGRSNSSNRVRSDRPSTPKRVQPVPARPVVVAPTAAAPDVISPLPPAPAAQEASVVHVHPSTSRFPKSDSPGSAIADQFANFSFDEAYVKSRKLSVVFDKDAIVADSRRPSKADSQMTMQNPHASCSSALDVGKHRKGASDITEEKEGEVESAPRRTAKYGDGEKGEDDTDSDEDVDGTGSRRNNTSSQRSGSSACEHNAVERLSEWFADLITPLIYFIVFIVGIPLFFVYDFALPLFLGINLLTFLASITIVPPKWRRYLHPILTTSVATVFIIWAFGEMKGLSLAGVLGYYSNGAKYSVLWSLSGYTGPVPGAGDVLFSTLDAGIVALAVPMYRYRRDLAENFTRMMLILTPCAALSLFFWPYIGHLFGLDDTRSLAFSARFMSTPLAIEMANNVGADEKITVIMVVVTGILAAILKEPFFKMMRVDMDDHIAVGVTLGSTAGAIGASSLISRPRTMAVASLAFVLFGALLLICAAIPAIVDIVRQFAGASMPMV